jgi:sugar phosphate isomerase/epimerase
VPKICLSTYCLFLEMSFREAILFAVKHGFEGIELLCEIYDAWPTHLTEEDRIFIRDICEENRLPLSLHSPSIGNNIASHNPGQRRESIRQLKETIALAGELGGQVVTVHPGRVAFFRLLSDQSDSPYSLKVMKGEAYRFLLDGLRECASLAQERGVVLCVENMGHLANDAIHTVEELRKLIDEVAHPSVKVTLDLSHAHIEGRISHSIETLQPHIRHVHVSDNFGRESSHFELGKGNIDLRPAVSFLKAFDGMIVLEVIDPEDAKGPVLRSREYLENILSKGL